MRIYLSLQGPQLTFSLFLFVLGVFSYQIPDPVYHGIEGGYQIFDLASGLGLLHLHRKISLLHLKHR